VAGIFIKAKAAVNYQHKLPKPTEAGLKLARNPNSTSHFEPRNLVLGEILKKRSSKTVV
jgi:hypothetical protein